MQESDDGSDSWRALGCVSVSFGAILLFVIMIPETMPANSVPGSFSLTGRFLGISVAAVCIAAFLQCPRRAVLAKFLTLLFLLPGVLVGVTCLVDSVLAIQGPYKAAQYLVQCQRLRLC
jgi:hypothetical protein